jgi:hypothetical protein
MCTSLMPLMWFGYYNDDLVLFGGILKWRSSSAL